MTRRERGGISVPCYKEVIVTPSTTDWQESPQFSFDSDRLSELVGHLTPLGSQTLTQLHACFGAFVLDDDSLLRLSEQIFEEYGNGSHSDDDQRLVVRLIKGPWDFGSCRQYVGVPFNLQFAYGLFRQGEVNGSFLERQHFFPVTIEDHGREGYVFKYYGDRYSRLPPRGYLHKSTSPYWWSDSNAVYDSLSLGDQVRVMIYSTPTTPTGFHHAVALSDLVEVRLLHKMNKLRG